ncbi:MAG: glycosyltransferase family 4 protein [Armatimonadota bacterium]
MNKILYCATVDYHFAAFHLPYMKWFKDQGWEVHVAAKGDMALQYCDVKHNVPFSRSPYSFDNIKAYSNLRRIMDETHYDIVHFHIPVSAAIGRLAAAGHRKKGTKVLYTSHGHYYYKGGPLLSWLLYFPIEKWLANYTDTLITITEEDYNISKKYQSGANKIEHIHGIGVDTSRFCILDKDEKCDLRKKNNYIEDDFLLISIGEFNRNKNQILLVKVISLLKDRIPNIKLLLVGQDSGTIDKCKQLASELNVKDYIDFLGYRTDINELLPICDVAVSASIREGLPVSIMEAMACGLPIVATNNRGHRELIHNNENGYIVPITAQSDENFADKIYSLYSSLENRRNMGQENCKVIRKYYLDNVLKEMCSIYSNC